jgi:hypothetical protein
MVGYIFGGNTGETEESLSRKRAVAMALASKASSAPKNVGEGLNVNRRRNGTPYRLPKGTPASGCIGSARVGPELSI